MVPDSLLARLSYLLGNLYRRSIELEVEQLQQLGIGVKHQAVLSVLADEGPMTQQELGRRLGIDRTTMVGVIDELEAAALLERTRNPADRRSYLLALTAVGHSHQAEGRKHVHQAETHLLEALDEQERRTLVALLAKALGPTTHPDSVRDRTPTATRKQQP